MNLTDCLKLFILDRIVFSTILFTICTYIISKHFISSLTLKGLSKTPQRSVKHYTYLVESENTHFLRKGKYHCAAKLLFDWFRFNQTSKYVFNSTYEKQLNQNKKQKVSRTVIVPLTK